MTELLSIAGLVLAFGLGAIFIGRRNRRREVEASQAALHRATAYWLERVRREGR